ncbi:MAG: Nif11-like leader peptide family RiPP precursor [Geitlerinemataceae cyanobacterium]
MTNINAAKLFNNVRQEAVLTNKEKALKHPRRFLKVAKERGYDFTAENLESEIDRLSEEELASLMNPGVGPRHHLVPR